jgi:CTP:molybdopterin cytidylyltransferase MocA
VTVAAVILAADAESALVDAAGRPSVRRIAEVAWAGGAVPLLVVVADPTGAVARALGGSEATVIATQHGGEPSVATMLLGVQAASALVGETSGVLVWPVRFPWVDAETVTSLIQAHGADPRSVLRPTWAGADGWPVLLPLEHLDGLEAWSSSATTETVMAALSGAGIPGHALDLGDPGATTDRATPLDRLPAYQGPPPPSTPAPEWGAAAAEIVDDGPPPAAPSFTDQPAR